MKNFGVTTSIFIATPTLHGLWLHVHDTNYIRYTLRAGFICKLVKTKLIANELVDKNVTKRYTVRVLP